MTRYFVILDLIQNLFIILDSISETHEHISAKIPLMRFRTLKNQSKNKQQTIKQETMENNALFPVYTDRIKAFITDLFMIYIPILYIIAYVVLNGKDAFQASTVAQFVGVALYALIYALFLSISGQTPGKKAYNIKVVDAKTQQKLSFTRALWRFVAFLLTATTLLGLFFPFYRKDKKALHDIMSASMNITTNIH
jgi:uncharacterized RDD family membrane protein YckC